jgi:hypothetical protein
MVITGMRRAKSKHLVLTQEKLVLTLNIPLKRSFDAVKRRHEFTCFKSQVCCVSEKELQSVNLNFFTGVHRMCKQQYGSLPTYHLGFVCNLLAYGLADCTVGPVSHGKR